MPVSDRAALTGILCVRERYSLELTAGLDLDTFFTESKKTGGCMAGTRRLALLEDSEAALGCSSFTPKYPQ